MIEINSNSGPKIIYCIANQSMIADKTDSKFAKYLQTVMMDTFDKSIKIRMVNNSFASFSKTFPYLCFRKFGCDIEKYPNQIINNQLFLGNNSDANNKQILKHLKITHIINMTLTLNVSRDLKKLKIKYLHCPIYDNHEVNIIRYFDKGINFINKALNKNKNGNIKKKVLVHCQAGISRSSTMIIAYLMKMKGMDFKTAYKYTKQRREIIEPNHGFVKQLKLYQQNGFVVKEMIDD